MIESLRTRKFKTGAAAFTLAVILTGGGAGAGCADRDRDTAEATDSDAIKLEKVIEAAGTTTVGSCLAENDSPYALEDPSFLSYTEGFGRREPDMVYVSASDGSSKEVLALEIERDSTAQVHEFGAADADSEELLIQQGCQS